MRRVLTKPVEIFASGNNYCAKALYFPDGRVKVLADSLISPTANNSVRSGDRERRDHVLEKNGGSARLSSDINFDSLSASAIFVSGNNCNGNTFWITVDNIEIGTYMEVDGTIEIKSEEAELTEGSRHIVSTDTIERNPKARQACLDHYGYSCQICGFDFEKQYGDGFKGIIQVHHIKPISEFGEEHAVDPITDLIPVCPNCHVALHSKKNGVYTPDELKVFVLDKRK